MRGAAVSRVPLPLGRGDAATPMAPKALVGMLGEEENSMADAAFPYPIIFGTLDKAKPFPRLNLKTEHGVQRVFSRTNYNLFLDEPEERASLSVGQFLKHFRELAGGCPNCIQPWNCCRLFVSSIERVSGRFGFWRITAEHAEWPNWGACGMYTFWLSQAQTRAEKRFLERYLQWIGSELQGTHRFLEGWDFDQGGRQFKEMIGWDKIITCVDELQQLLEENGRPALIPQVWLNFIYDSKLGLADPQREHLHDNPGVVDFVMLHNGRKHIIEIDDPGHYATFDKNQQKYVVSEEQYTKNLRIERRLRWDGWEIHRFSNWEVLNSFNAAYVLAILGVKEPHELESVGDYLKEDRPEELPF